MRGERGSTSDPSAIASSNSSSTVSARKTPDCASSASTARSLPASAPVCEDAARAPVRERPDLTTTMGLVLLIRPAISRNRDGLPKLSTYIRITATAGSSSQYKSRSLLLTSVRFPIETNCAMPMPYSRA